MSIFNGLNEFDFPYQPDENFLFKNYIQLRPKIEIFNMNDCSSI